MLNVTKPCRYFTIFSLSVLSACGGSSDGQPNVTVSFSASPSTVVAGNPVTLEWSSTNATRCTASGGWSGTKASSGSETVTPESAGTVEYSVSCRGEGEAYGRSVSVEVLPVLEVSAAAGALSTAEDASVSLITSPPTAMHLSRSFIPSVPRLPTAALRLTVMSSLIRQRRIILVATPFRLPPLPRA